MEKEYSLGRPNYTLDDVLLDLKVLRSAASVTLEEAEGLIHIAKSVYDRSINPDRIFEQADEKRRFLREVLGYTVLYGKGGSPIALEDCTNARVGRAFRNIVLKPLTLFDTIVDAAKRLKEHISWAKYDHTNKKQEVSLALENFKADHPDKYKANCMAALRA